MTPDGTITRIADLSENNMVPTAFRRRGDGGIFIGNLNEFPFLDGTSKVSDLAPDGTATNIGTGLSMVTGLAVGDDGTVYAVEIATGDPTGPQDPQFLPMTCRSVRQTSQDSLEPVVIGLTLPVSLDTDAAGLLYTSVPAIGADAGTGMFISFDVSAGGVSGVSTSPLTANRCEPLDTNGGTARPDAAATPVA